MSIFPRLLKPKTVTIPRMVQYSRGASPGFTVSGSWMLLSGLTTLIGDGGLNIWNGTLSKITPEADQKKYDIAVTFTFVLSGTLPNGSLAIGLDNGLGDGTSIEYADMRPFNGGLLGGTSYVQTLSLPFIANGTMPRYLMMRWVGQGVASIITISSVKLQIIDPTTTQ